MNLVLTYYHDLHKIPEISGQEYETAQYIFYSLEEMGYTPQHIGETGIFADLVTDPAGPWILLRADTDALAIQESSCAAVISEHPGVMHACGHDGHSAMLLTAARELYGKRLPQNVRFLFQPAEETTKGAAEMIECGVIPRNLRACFAMHLWPGVPKGVAVTTSSKMMASSDVFRIQIQGRQAHCAQQKLGADALRTAVEIGAGLPAIQEEAEEAQTILFCGSIHSGSSHNVVPDSASMMGTIRSFSARDREHMKTQLETLCQKTASCYGTKVLVEWDGGCPALRNDPVLIGALRDLDPAVQVGLTPTMAAEDFACYQEYAPGVMLWVGIGDTPPLHNGAFYIPEDILSEGVALWQKIAQHDWDKEGTPWAAEIQN